MTAEKLKSISESFSTTSKLSHAPAMGAAKVLVKEIRFLMVTKLWMARVKTGLSLRAFAQANKLSESLLSKMETGKYYIPEN